MARDLLVWVDGPLPRSKALLKEIDAQGPDDAPIWPRESDLWVWSRGVAEVCDVAAVWTPREKALHLCRWPLGALVDALRELQAQGLRTRLTVWATSDAHGWAQQSAWLRDVYELCAVGGVERPGLDLDAEEAWRGAGTIESIGDFVAQWRLSVSVSYVPSVRLSSSVRALLRCPWVGEVIPQAYSQWQSAKPWTHDKLIRPRTFQRHALEQAREVIAERAHDAPPVVLRCGLMAAFQQHPPPSPQGIAALDAAVGEIAAQGVESVAIWSAKHLSDAERRAWASGLKARCAAGLTQEVEAAG